MLAAGWDMILVFPDGDDAGKLAQMLHSSLVLLILYYLDTRKTRNEPLPWWLTLFGVSYTASTARIYALFPRTCKDPDTQEIRWSFNVSLLTALHSETELFPPLNITLRKYLIVALLRIREHIAVLSEHLVQWQGPALDQLQRFQRRRRGGFR